MSESLSKYFEAGKIAVKLKEEARKIVDIDVPLVDICDRLELLAFELGGKPAFPVNIGVNEVTAHFTSPANDFRKIPENSIVKIDIGVHVEGYIADTAITLSFNRDYHDLITSAQNALLSGINAMQPGVKISHVGAIIEKTITRFGYRPIRNLMGHRIERFNLHTGKSIPNISGIEGGKIEEGEVYAVEPFSTLQDAAGMVRDSNETVIFRYHKDQRLKSRDAMTLLDHIKKEHRFLPFASRWLRSKFSFPSFDKEFEQLIKSRCIIPYRVLVEASGLPVSQAEHTVIVEKDGCRIIT
ncbi:type II methionyl aminopeptidase [[Eubacterium] cellulosolvens]